MRRLIGGLGGGAQASRGGSHTRIVKGIAWMYSRIPGGADRGGRRGTRARIGLAEVFVQRPTPWEQIRLFLPFLPFSLATPPFPIFPFSR